MKIYRDLYKDSVSLMQLSAGFAQRDGVERASIVMATETNLRQLEDAGFDPVDGATPNDLIVALIADDTVIDDLFEQADSALKARPAANGGDGPQPLPPSSFEMAIEGQPDANMAVVSVPGPFAAAEAIKALRLGLNVMLFSDNVPPAQELEVKKLARERGLLVMGPDCGTAIINGVPLGFANVVNRGKIGIVAASGTGLQEVSCRISNAGAGISQAIGTGGHDLAAEIGGLSMLTGIEMLIADPQTEVIVLVSKPPSAEVAKGILGAACAGGKPVVVHFLGADAAELKGHNVIVAESLAEAGEKAVAVLRGDAPEPLCLDDLPQAAMRAAERLVPQAQYLRGVFCGGTFCAESQLFALRAGLKVHSNVPVRGAEALNDIWISEGHSIVDLGDDDFTRGRAHPMIDPTLRDERIVSDGTDPLTGVIQFDVVLGYGASMEPIEGLLEALRRVKEARSAPPVFVAHVCGTDLDPQSRHEITAQLQAEGVIAATSNAQASVWASAIAVQCQTAMASA
nr:acyl-CoA synthetase FdrA [Palleronia sediminis]